MGDILTFSRKFSAAFKNTFIFLWMWYGMMLTERMHDIYANILHSIRGKMI